MAADSRTNAGVDYISTYKKLFDFSQPGERVILICTSGSLSITQGVLSQLQRDIKNQEEMSLHTLSSLYDITRYIGNTVRLIVDENRSWLERDKIDYQCSFIVGGQIKGEEPQLFMVYTQGNYIITASEGANLHFTNLRSRPHDFDPATRDRFLAGALIPSHWYLQAQRFRQWYRDRIREIFQTVDIILAPTTPCVAPKIGQTTMVIAGEEVLVRPNLGLYTQPLSFIGLPVLSVPVHLPGYLPLGVQIIAAPYNEALILRVAAVLEARGIVAAPVVQ